MPRRRFRPAICAQSPSAHGQGVTTALPCVTPVPDLGTASREGLLPQHPELSLVLLAARSHSDAVQAPGGLARHRGHHSPVASELPRLVVVVEVVGQVSSGSSSPPRGSHGTCRVLPGRSHHGLVRPCFQGSEPTSYPLPVHAAVRGSATSPTSLTGKGFRPFHS